MDCPKCNGDEIDSSGVCLVCGYQASGDKSEATQKSVQNGALTNAAEMNHSDKPAASAEEGEMPQWRVELARRLQDIRQRREMAGDGKLQINPGTPQSSSPTALQPKPKPAGKQERMWSQTSAREFPAPSAKSPDKKSDLPLFSKSDREKKKPLEIELLPLRPVPKESNHETYEIHKLIDKAISSQNTQASNQGSAAKASPYQYSTNIHPEGKLILLSRTLSGLVDIIVVLLCTGAIIIAADFFSGINMLDSVSLIIYSILLLLTYFLYSIFFLSISYQTIGMMMTDLRMVDPDQKRPLVRQLWGRCFGYLISLLGLGIGLLWGLFDRENRCLHDLLSNTRIVRQ